jgi:hypothetical protein
LSRALAVLLVLASTACGPSLSPPEHVERTRVLAARSRADAEPTRAQLVAGESAVIEYLIVSPSPRADPIGASFAACWPAHAAAENGVVGCASDPFALETGRAGGDGSPILQMPFVVPADMIDTSLITHLATCVGGSAVLDPIAPSAGCDGVGRAELHRLVVSLTSDVTIANHNPDIRGERYTIDDALWTEPSLDVDASGCAERDASSSLPIVHRGAAAVLGVGCSPEERETYGAYDADRRPIVVREVIELALFATLGTLDDLPPFDDDAQRVLSTTWTPPADDDLTEAQREALPTGLLVRLWLVARDRRGGTDWIERDLCLVP